MHQREEIQRLRKEVSEKSKTITALRKTILEQEAYLAECEGGLDIARDRIAEEKELRLSYAQESQIDQSRWKRQLRSLQQCLNESRRFSAAKIANLEQKLGAALKDSSQLDYKVKGL